MSEHPASLSSAALDEVPRSYEAAVEGLAAAHAAGMTDITIYSMPDVERKIVRLVEVSIEFPEAGVDRPTPPGVLERVVPVFPMGPAKDFPFRSEIAQVTPKEWSELLKGDLRLTKAWGDLNEAQVVKHVE